jgi:hypothetical protein
VSTIISCSKLNPKCSISFSSYSVIASAPKQSANNLKIASSLRSFMPCGYRNDGYVLIVVGGFE